MLKSVWKWNLAYVFSLDFWLSIRNICFVRNDVFFRHSLICVYALWTINMVSLFVRVIIYCLFPSFYWWIDSWESLSGPCAPKPCLTSSIPKHVRRVSMRMILFYLLSHALWAHPYYREYLRTGPTVWVPEHAPQITCCSLPCGVTLGMLTAVPLFSKWSMLFITGLSATRRKIIVCGSPILHMQCYALVCSALT